VAAIILFWWLGLSLQKQFLERTASAAGRWSRAASINVTAARPTISRPSDIWRPTPW
jgi:hypothetical protein